MILLSTELCTIKRLGTDENIVDGNVVQLHEIAHQTHSDETNRRSGSCLGKLYNVIRRTLKYPSYRAWCICSQGTCCHG